LLFATLNREKIVATSSIFKTRGKRHQVRKSALRSLRHRTPLIFIKTKASQISEGSFNPIKQKNG
jgi:K+-sensing histidine kinase KdpD